MVLDNVPGGPPGTTVCEPDTRTLLGTESPGGVTTDKAPLITTSVGVVSSCVTPPMMTAGVALAATAIGMPDTVRAALPGTIVWPAEMSVPEVGVMREPPEVGTDVDRNGRIEAGEGVLDGCKARTVDENVVGSSDFRTMGCLVCLLAITVD